VEGDKRRHTNRRVGRRGSEPHTRTPVASSHAPRGRTPPPSLNPPDRASSQQRNGRRKRSEERDRQGESTHQRPPSVARAEGSSAGAERWLRLSRVDEGGGDHASSSSVVNIGETVEITSKLSAKTAFRAQGGGTAAAVGCVAPRRASRTFSSSRGGPIDYIRAIFPQ